ncbi:hypothetical protein H0H81_012616 [Sphagnurus paluster]|uniref:Uncharacterized protein n=1 Tax=Sphagnurus paluster TaxID=117069 RepID=A0A9P7FQG7_9AGAR|nr:hypothetical protein H0H81_012616 [Sphagnurus paluster]
MRAFEDSPDLREARIPTGHHELHLPWSQLTTLGGNHISREILLEIPNLVELDFFRDFDVVVFPNQTTRLLSLKRLRVVCGDSLEWLEAPHLESLHMSRSRCFEQRPTDMYMIHSLVRRSGCNLRSLSLSGMNVGGDAESLEGLVVGIPSLLRLELENCDVIWTLLSGIVAPTDKSRRLPDIQHFTVTFGQEDSPGHLESSTVDLLEFLSTAGEGVSCLLSAQLLNVVISVEGENRLLHLKKNGLRVLHGKRLWQ